MLVLVTGATGNVGGELVTALLANGDGVRALTRAGKEASLPEGVERVHGDLNRPDTLAPALDGVEGVFLLGGFADMPGVITQFHGAGVRRVVLLSSGAVVRGEVENAVTRYNLVSEAAVRDGEVPWTILRPSGFMANALRWVDELAEGDVVRAPFADVPVAAIDPADIAAVALAALTEDGHAGRTYRLSGPEALRPADQVAILASVLGRDLRCEAVPDDIAHEEMRAAMPAAYADAFFRYFAEGTYDDSQVHPDVTDVLGRPPRTFEQWARAHAGAFAP